MTGPRTFEELIAEGTAVPVEGWDFSWFAGRATEERPPWGYARRLGEQLRQATVALDIQTGGGEVVAWALADGGGRPALLAATESWPPNLALARQALAPYGGQVTEAADEADLPFGPETFDLVSSRHPTMVRWPEVARVLRPGGTYFSQQIGTGTNRELYEFLMGPQPEGSRVRASEHAVADARRAGLQVLDLQEQALRVEFFDVAAVVVFLRKVIWTVPDFTVDRYLERLARMHELISASGSFVSYAQRFLIEARKPDSATSG